MTLRSDDNQETSSTRQLSDRLVLAVCMIFLIRFFAAELYRIPTHSMMPTLAGPHYAANCPSCQWAITMAGTNPPPAAPCRCPNCRQEIEPIWKPVAADQALVLKQGAAGIARYDVIAFKSPEDPRTPFVKRVVGLPGETISVRNGEITRLDPKTGEFEICPKPIEQVIESSRIVYDDRYRAPNIPLRWRSPDDSWQAEKTGYRLMKSEGQLSYHHLGPSGRPESIADDEPFLSSSTTAGSNLVHDAILELTWHPATADGEIMINITSPFSRRTLRVTAKEASIGTTSIKLLPISSSSRLRWGYVDGAWLGWQDDRFLGRWIDPPSDSPTTYDPSAGIQVSIAGAGQGSRLTDLVLRRDLHYRAYAWEVSSPISTDPIWGESTSVWTLGPDEFLALGDNTTKSRDSRHWQHGPGLPARLILGKVVARFSTTRQGWFHRLATGTGDLGTVRTKPAGPIEEPTARGNDSRNATR